MHISADRPGQIGLTAPRSTARTRTRWPALAEQLELSGRCARHVAPNYQHVEAPIVYDPAGDAGLAFRVVLALTSTGGGLTAGPHGLHVDGADAVSNSA